MNEIRANYPALEQIAQRFTGEADAIQNQLQVVRARMVSLHDSWQGLAARRFFAEMDEAVLPALDRLREGLSEAARTTLQICETLRQAEEEAAALFSGGEGDVGAPAFGMAPAFSALYGGRDGAESGEAGIPPPPPPPGQGATDGSAAHGSGGAPTDDDQRVHDTMRQAAAAADLAGRDVTARHMNHFLDNTGEPITDVNVDAMMSDMPLLQEHVNAQFSQELTPQINQYIDSNYNGEQIQFTVESGWRSDFYPDRDANQDWYYGVGGFSYSQTALVTVTPNPEGGPPIATVESQVHMFDRYNWDAGKSVTIPSIREQADSVPVIGPILGPIGGWLDDHTIASDHIDDTQMGRLHLVGIAQEYDLSGSSSIHTQHYIYDPATQSIIPAPPSSDGR